MMAMKIQLLFLWLSASHSKGFEFSIIGDIIKLNRPASIIYFGCWSPSQIVNLYNSKVNNKDEMKMVQLITDVNKSTPNLNYREQYIFFVADLSCPDVGKYLEMCNSRKYFREPFRWILFQNESDGTVVPEAVIKLDILVDMEVIVISPKTKESYNINMIYKISHQGSWRKEHYGTWDITNGLQKMEDFKDVTALRRQNLQGYQLRICYVMTNNDSVHHLTDGINDHIDTITKANFRTTNHLVDFLNAGRKYLYADSWGYRVNGSWNGMCGYFARGEVEIGGTPMFFTADRLPIVEFISSPTPSRSAFIFKEPKLSYENNLFLLSFRSTVWFSALALVFLLFLSLFLVTYWEWKRRKHIQSRASDAAILRPNVCDIVILVFGATCQQGSPVELKGSLGRIVLLILFLTLMFLYTSYSANIVALLQSSSSKIRTLEDLYHSRIKLGVHDTVFNRYYFTTATEPVRKAIYEKKVAPAGSTPQFISLEEGVKKIQKGLFAFHMEMGVGYKLIGKYFEEGEKCGLREIEYIQVINPWLGAKKNTPYKEVFKIGLKRIQEHGLQYRENRLVYEKRPKCSGRESSFVSVSMVDCYPALLVLCYGSLVALTVLSMEKMHYSRNVIKRKLLCGDKSI